jgi:signal peptidase
MGIWVAPAPPPERVLHPPTTRGHIAGRATTALLALSLVLLALVAAGAAAGYRGSVILTGSMQPALAPGDLVVVHSIAAAAMRPGEIVAFRDEHGTTITHRVKAVATRRDGSLAVTTQGDANNVSERWDTTPEATVGRVVTAVPQLGRVTSWTGSETGRLLVLGAIGALIAGYALRRIWSG